MHILQKYYFGEGQKFMHVSYNEWSFVIFLIILLWRHFVPKQNNWKVCLREMHLKSSKCGVKYIGTKNLHHSNLNPGLESEVADWSKAVET